MWSVSSSYMNQQHESEIDQLWENLTHLWQTVLLKNDEPPKSGNPQIDLGRCHTARNHYQSNDNIKNPVWAYFHCKEKKALWLSLWHRSINQTEMCDKNPDPLCIMPSLERFNTTHSEDKLSFRLPNMCRILHRNICWASTMFVCEIWRGRD